MGIGRRQRLLRGIGVSVGALAVLVGGTAVALGGRLPGASPHRRAPASTTTTTVAYAGPQRYEFWGTVLDAPGSPAILCDSVLESLPPRCGKGRTVRGWDWHAVGGGYAIDHDVRRGDFHVVGTLVDGEIRLTQPADHEPAPKPVRAPEEQTDPPCRPPRGGWKVVDEDRYDQASETAMLRAARAEPDFAGVFRSGRPRAVFTVAFTGDLARHRRELAALWGGPICVVRHPTTRAALQAAQDRLTADVVDRRVAGATLTSVGVDEVDGVLRVGVELDPEGGVRAIQARLAERYGVPVRVGTEQLRPYPG
ncbi:hypothetical protein KSP35_09285 [Aquihabitans sp. G128]|uniref:hypothetical protein n=1 Tax=Aquihabitans sp. G128 TaxID=2849779 RepID=UPI001C226E2A|nr:hypothetical protein [Aquihabitans sp. G128]QXC62951.1 hypothetical protein KSP35_09285 [Aquihabitans sp. G128]